MMFDEATEACLTAALSELMAAPLTPAQLALIRRTYGRVTLPTSGTNQVQEAA